MDEKTALHTAARCYCLERAPGLDPRHEEQWYRDRRWKRKNRELVSVWSDSRGTVAQIDVSGAILFEIERFVPENFASVHALRAFLTTVAQEVFAPNDPDTTMEHDREKALFQHYIELLSEHDLHNVAPLPYRRVLKKHELDTMWERVEHQGYHAENGVVSAEQDITSSSCRCISGRLVCLLHSARGTT